jgi:hypothetical protein
MHVLPQGDLKASIRGRKTGHGRLAFDIYYIDSDHLAVTSCPMMLARLLYADAYSPG